MLRDVQLEENGKMQRAACSGTKEHGWLRVIFRSLVDVLMCVCTAPERYVLGWRERQWRERQVG